MGFGSKPYVKSYTRGWVLMKKILLVTLQDVNIGNRLQNYALQTVLEDMGYEVFNPVYSLDRAFVKTVKIALKCLLYRYGVKKYAKVALNHKRKRAFQELDSMYIHNKINIGQFDTNNIDLSEFNYAITGSDQVWHKWTDSPKELPYFYLQFIEENKRISYAPSFGFVNVPQIDIETHISGINGIYSISCREDSGAEIVRKLTGRVAKIASDPTMLLSKNEWKAAERKPCYNIPTRFILIYFLGDISEEYWNHIKTICEDNEAVPLRIFSVDDPEYYCTMPNEFIWLVENATCICTDSFHACVFSIIFEKKFVVYQRKESGMEKMFDRIECLLKDFGLTSCIWNNRTVNSEIDYEKVALVLKEKKEEGTDFLKLALQTK